MKVDVYESDFGIVGMVETKGYMDRLDPNWREIVNNKRRRGKHARFLREKLAALETYMNVACELAWIRGEIPREL